MKKCINGARVKKLCFKHYQRLRAKGSTDPSPRKNVYDKEGYIIVHIEGKQFKEHRLIMEAFLERSLSKKETVHHINGDRSDNRIENLQLRQGHHGSGIVMQCSDCGSHRVAPVPL